MRIGDVLYFSPGFRFSELDFDNEDTLVEAFQNRVEGFYLQPASRSLQSGDAFAGGLVCCAAIEFIAKSCGDEHGSDWLYSNIAAFQGDEKLAGRFWNYFRDGLAHEGRVKSYGGGSGQFSMELAQMVTIIGSVMVVNPRLLLEAVRGAFRRRCDEINPDQIAILGQFLRRYFEAEVKTAKG